MQPLAQLFEPDETPNITMPIADAVEYCRTHPGWVWALVTPDSDCCGA